MILSFNKLFISANILFMSATAFAAPTQMIDKAFLVEKLEEFTGERKVLINGEEIYLSSRSTKIERTNATLYLKKEYEKLGLQVELKKYRTGVNVVAEIKGLNPDKVLIIGSHYDGVRNSPGADDNGSGTIGALAIARYFITRPTPKYTLRFIAFDQEEKGTVGSKNYVAQLSKEGKLSTIKGAILMEMLGYDADQDGAFHIVDCARSARRIESGSDVLTKMILAGLDASQVDLKRSTACTTRSDHSRFWQKGIPAIVVSEDFFGGDSNPCYHKSCDNVAQLDFDYMQKNLIMITTGIELDLNK